jgi:hypothetical protein
MNEILNALSNKLIVGGIFRDLEKAYRYVNHYILPSKLESNGITGKDKEHYQSYLKYVSRVVIYSKTHHCSTLSKWASNNCCPTGFCPGRSAVASVYE